MAFDARTHTRRRLGEEFFYQEKNVAADLAKSRPMSPKAQLEQEKRLRREIANSNERRRMQCINAGFQGLRALMPQLNGEKLSKAAILQHTKDYIAKKEQELKQAKNQNEQLKRMLMDMGRERDLERSNDTPPPKRKKRDTECSDEGIGMVEMAADGAKDVPTVDDLHRDLVELRQQLERERLLRMMMEERARALETQLLHSQPPRHPSPLLSSATSLPSPINLKVESPVNKPCSNVQEVSAHEDRIQQELAYKPSPRRNLENLVEAIRQIEGDRVLCGGDDKYLSQERHSVMNSEESEKDSSVSDPEESKSEGSGRDSPSPLGLCTRLGFPSTAISNAPQAAHQGILSEKFPIASHLLHRPPCSPYYRPGVIVHKS